MSRRPAIFHGSDEQHRADTCDPLVAAVAAGELRLEALVRGSYPGRPMPAGVLAQVSSIGFWDAEIGQLIESSRAGPPPSSRLTLLANEVFLCLLELLHAQNPPRKVSLTLGERSVEMFL